MNNPFSFFDKIFYINLDSRPDRRDIVEENFRKIGITAERFPAIVLSHEQNQNLIKDGCVFRGEERPVHSRYTKSCALSHLSVILRAKLMEYENVLIFEDDVIFHDDILEELSKSIEELKTMDRWDMFYLGCNPMQYKKISPHLGKSLGAFGGHAYAVNRHFYDVVLNIPFKHMPCIDMYYEILGQHNPNHNLFMALKNLVWQAPGYSDLEEAEVDYFFATRARYDSNMIEE